jgi:hypothetical protein
MATGCATTSPGTPRQLTGDLRQSTHEASNRRDTTRRDAGPIVGAVVADFGPSSCSGDRSGAPRVTRHVVFVRAEDGRPLTPTTPARARRLLKAGVARRVWSKLGTFGIQLATAGRAKCPATTLGMDPGAGREGYVVLCGTEASVAVQLVLPTVEATLHRLRQRRQMRRERRQRRGRGMHDRRGVNSRRGRACVRASEERAALAVPTASRLHLIWALLACYPVQQLAVEIAFPRRRGQRCENHEMLHEVFATLRARGIAIAEVGSLDSQRRRQRLGLEKAAIKTANSFWAHCSDALAVVSVVTGELDIAHGPFLSVSDRWRPVLRGGAWQRRNPGCGGRAGSVSKGCLGGTPDGQVGLVLGFWNGSWVIGPDPGRRQRVPHLSWTSGQYAVLARAMAPYPSQAAWDAQVAAAGTPWPQLRVERSRSATALARRETPRP